MKHGRISNEAYVEAFKKTGGMSNLKRLAEKGNAEMQYALAVNYRLDNDVSSAEPWYRKVAAQGYTLAQYSVNRL